MANVNLLEKSTTTSVADPSTTGGLWNNVAFPNSPGNQIWTYCAGDVISDAVEGSDPLVAWLPAEPTNVWNDNVAHLSYLTGEGFDGSETYLEYIAAVSNPAECDYGEGDMDFNICEYTSTLARVSTSNKNNPLNRMHFGGMRYCEREPQFRIRGEMRGIQIDNDADWILSKLALDYEQHIAWSTIHGDASITTNKGLFDGLDTVVSQGYVTAHKVGSGSCEYTDPIVVSGTSLDTPEKILRKIIAITRRIRRRMAVRNFRPAPGDQVVVMPLEFWNQILDVISWGALTPGSQPGRIDFTTTPEVWQRLRDTYGQGGLGYGFIPMEDGPLWVMVNDNIASNSTAASGMSSITSDIYILTKRYKNINALALRYLNWNNIIGTPAPGVGNSQVISPTNGSVFQNGMVRASWQEVNNLCYWYGMESYLGMVTRMQYLQAKITDVTLEVNDAFDLMEGPTYMHPNFYAYEGRGTAGGGTPLITPYNS